MNKAVFLFLDIAYFIAFLHSVISKCSTIDVHYYDNVYWEKNPSLMVRVVNPHPCSSTPQKKKKKALEGKMLKVKNRKKIF